MLWATLGDNVTLVDRLIRFLTETNLLPYMWSYLITYVTHSIKVYHLRFHSFEIINIMSYLSNYEIEKAQFSNLYLPSSNYSLSNLSFVVLRLFFILFNFFVWICRIDNNIWICNDLKLTDPDVSYYAVKQLCRTILF